jgi:hypothetical protein
VPIRPFLNGQRFDQETVRILGVAFEQVCIALRIGDCGDDVKNAIANKIIELGKTGERNPDVLCEHALKDIRQPPG